MDSSHLTPAQAARLRDAVRRHLDYIGRLRRRMEIVGFPPDDRAYRAASAAHDALQELHVLAHYRACTSGVGLLSDHRDQVRQSSGGGDDDDDGGVRGTPTAPPRPLS